jgi:hypothetical protein
MAPIPFNKLLKICGESSNSSPTTRGEEVVALAIVAMRSFQRLSAQLDFISTPRWILALFHHPFDLYMRASSRISPKNRDFLIFR